MDNDKIHFFHFKLGENRIRTPLALMSREYSFHAPCVRSILVTRRFRNPNRAPHPHHPVRTRITPAHTAPAPSGVPSQPEQ
jgi:hypothetical protein